MGPVYCSDLDSLVCLENLDETTRALRKQVETDTREISAAMDDLMLQIQQAIDAKQGVKTKHSFRPKQALIQKKATSTEPYAVVQTQPVSASPSTLGSKGS